MQMYFNPRSPRGERHAGITLAVIITRYFNPRSPRGERLGQRMDGTRTIRISIHAPREGSDYGQERQNPKRLYFNPRSPRGERHGVPKPEPCACRYFNPRSPRGERPGRSHGAGGTHGFQSTLPARGATMTSTGHPLLYKFQSTLPARGATSSKRSAVQSVHISIHAPREGSDQSAILSTEIERNFNPRSPRGERPFQRKP